jgi:putative membrane protein
MWEWHGAGFGGGFMWIFWILIIFAIVMLIKAVGKSNNSNSEEHRETPLEILEKRYARGEIDDQEFAHRKQELGG